ncbi:MAG: ABC transporter permease subunit [Dehalococcoidia bacterium]|nr:ABC transporter permease subunit [Dehalococcoidia bacterium]
MAAAARVVAARRPWHVRARRWARANLFSSGWNTLLTAVTLAVGGYITFALLRFVLVSADWGVIEANRRLIFLGRFPQGEEWRVWPPLWAFLLLAGASYGLWGRLRPRDAVVFVLSSAFLYAFMVEGANALLLGIGLALAIGTWAASDALVRGSRYEELAKRITVGGWALLVPFLLFMLAGFGGVRSSLWGGLLLNVVVATVAMEAALVLGVLFALGRASSLPLVSRVSALYIEVIRGAPLIAWIFIGWFVLPAFLPPILGLQDIGLVLRAMLIFSFFEGAYIAEIVRGGLQSVPRGQVEAAHAVGLGAVRTMTLIVLPQALRNVIPALVGQLITLWKDTSLVAIIALTDAVGAAQAAIAQREFIGRQAEVLLFVAFLFWTVAFVMSRLSQQLERALGVGQR